MLLLLLAVKHILKRKDVFSFVGNILKDYFWGFEVVGNIFADGGRLFLMRDILWHEMILDYYYYYHLRCYPLNYDGYWV